MRSITVALTLFAFASPAQAEIPNVDGYVGLSGGGNLITNDWDLNEFDKDADDPVSPESSGILKIRGGVQLMWWLAIEGSVAWLPFTAAGEDNNAFDYEVDALFHLMEGDWTPFLDVGAGLYHNPDGDVEADTDPQLHWGLGMRGMVHDHVALRAEARHVLSDGMDGEVSNNIELTGGVDFFFRGRTPPPPADSDGDGIADTDDSCPQVAGTPDTQGCPDRDADGIADDNDGCPDVAGPKALNGCRDADGDGVADKDDTCPQVKGEARHAGCPDTDGDGVIDSADTCPEAAGVSTLAGCPDGDGDGIADKDDKCPSEKGVDAHGGCAPPPAAVMKRFSGSLEGVNFESGTAELTEKSKPVLDDVAKALIEYETLRLAVEGHTDSTGDAAQNQALSQSRADAVRDYLVAKGVAAGRLEPKGFGPDKPIADNGTREGQAKNRRIEFRVLTK